MEQKIDIEDVNYELISDHEYKEEESDGLEEITDYSYSDSEDDIDSIFMMREEEEEFEHWTTRNTIEN